MSVLVMCIYYIGQYRSCLTGLGRVTGMLGMSGGVSLGAGKVCAIYRTIWGEEAQHPIKDPKIIHC